MSPQGRAPLAVVDGVWFLPGPAGSETTSACVLIADGQDTTLVDPGPRTAPNRQRLRSALASLDRAWDRVTRVIITHSHSDHAGIADDLRSELGARVLLHRADQAAANHYAGQPPVDPVDLRRRWGLDDGLWRRLRERVAGPHGPAEAILEADHLTDGTRLDFPSSSWQVVGTPGHTPGHICLVNSEHRLAVLGDHLLPDLFPGVGLSVEGGWEPVHDYLDSLRRLEDYDSYLGLPGHGEVLVSLGDRRRETLAHVQRRIGEVAAVLRETPHARAAQIAPQLHWTAGWNALSRSEWVFSALWQVDLYRHYVLSGVDGQSQS
jgi:glyoxylase-like metal-dependent hydrolase (beta-lactamase superfamily II)